MGCNKSKPDQETRSDKNVNDFKSNALFVNTGEAKYENNDQAFNDDLKDEAKSFSVKDDFKKDDLINMSRDTHSTEIIKPISMHDANVTPGISSSSPVLLELNEAYVDADKAGSSYSGVPDGKAFKDRKPVKYSSPKREKIFKPNFYVPLPNDEILGNEYVIVRFTNYSKNNSVDDVSTLSSVLINKSNNSIGAKRLEDGTFSYTFKFCETSAFAKKLVATKLKLPIGEDADKIEYDKRCDKLKMPLTKEAFNLYQKLNFPNTPLHIVKNERAFGVKFRISDLIHPFSTNILERYFEVLADSSEKCETAARIFIRELPEDVRLYVKRGPLEDI